jgi:hypothetical protein
MNSERGSGEVEARNGRPVERKFEMEHFWKVEML